MRCDVNISVRRRGESSDWASEWRSRTSTVCDRCIAPYNTKQSGQIAMYESGQPSAERDANI